MADGRGFETFEETFDLSKKFRLNAKGEISKHDARKMFSTLDVDGDNEVSEHELARWVYQNNVFGTMPENDVNLTVKRVFLDIDKNRDGSLQFEEFYKFIREILKEQQTLKYVSRHHLTQLPSSLRKMNSSSFTLKAIEEALQEKIQRLTSRDGDRFRQILVLLKTQSQRSNDIPMGSEDKVMGISKRDFNTVLALLGLFATKQQAEELFQRYDINGDGNLTTHEFLTKVREQDYPGYEVDASVDDLRMGRGKRMYLKQTLLGTPVRPQTPSQRIYFLSKKEICQRIRHRLETRARCGQAFSVPLARRTLNRIFEDHDEEVPKRGLLTQKNLGKALAKIGLDLGNKNIAALMEDHGVVLEGYPEDLFDYRGFVMYTYPSQGEAPSTSLFRPLEGQPEMGRPQSQRPQTVQQWRSPNSRATPKSRSRAQTPSATMGRSMSRSLINGGMTMGPNGYKGSYLPQQQFMGGFPSV